MNDKLLRESLLATINGKTHMTFQDAIRDFPEAFINTRPPHLSYSFWHILEHIRRTQIDILEYIRNKAYKEPTWPDDYWPKGETTIKGWEETITKYYKDLNDVIALIEDANIDLFTKVNNGKGATIYHEILLIADHTSYHIGEFAILRQVLNLWPKNHK